jgi:hypothetical protein
VQAVLPKLTTEGLLPPGIHRVDLAEVRRAFVRSECGDVELRRAVYAALTTWATLGRRAFGPGRVLVGGGFTSRGEPSDTALAVYVPDDDVIAEMAATSGSAADLVSLKNVIYSYPGGGGLPERWPVSGVLDAHVTDRHAEIAYRKALSVVQGVDGYGVQGAAKGIVELEVRMP